MIPVGRTQSECTSLESPVSWEYIFVLLHTAFEEKRRKRRAALTAEDGCTSFTYNNQALSDIKYQISRDGYKIIELIGDNGNHEVRATYKIRGDDHLDVASYAQRSSTRA
jgi:hypothetical protein